MKAGEVCICQHDDWYNGFGEKSEAVHRGMRLTVIAKKNIGGQIFHNFEEVDRDNWYWSAGFKPMRSLN